VKLSRDRSDATPVGDWWVDDRCPSKIIARHDLRLQGAFVIRLVLGGRLSNELTLTLAGEPTLHLSARRGLKDNYIVVRDDAGALIDVTTLDPTPGPDLRAIAAQLVRAAAAACLVIAFVGLIAVALPRAAPAAKGRNSGGPSRTLLSRMALPAAIGLAGIGAVVSAWTAVAVLDGLPHQIDEVVYLLQARWLLDGDVAPAATTIQDHLPVPFTYTVGDRWVGHYPIGWPVVLAAGLALGVPHLVTSLLGVGFVVLVFLLGREIDDEVTGLAAALLALVSPLARLLSSSMFPHLACAVLVGAALWLLLVSRRRGEWWWGAGAGAAMGCCLAVRPMTAVAVAVIMGGWLVIRAFTTDRTGSTRLTIAAATGAGLVTSIPTLVHNATITGSPWALPYSLAPGSMYGLDNIAFGIRNLDAILVSASSSLFGWGWPVFPGGLTLALPLALVAMPWILGRTRSDDWLLLAVLLAVALGHLPTRAHGLHGYGARYVVDVAACLFLLGGRGFREIARWARPNRAAVHATVGLFLALNATALAALPFRLGLYRGYYGVTGELERRIESRGLAKAVILIVGDDWEPWGEGARLMTGPRRHEIIIAADLGDNTVLETTYPDRPFLRWVGGDLHRDERGGP
jgi:hypothetical protein